MGEQEPEEHPLQNLNPNDEGNHEITVEIKGHLTPAAAAQGNGEEICNPTVKIKGHLTQAAQGSGEENHEITVKIEGHLTPAAAAPDGIPVEATGHLSLTLPAPIDDSAKVS